MAQRFRVSLVVFTVGEPMLFYDEVVTALKQIGLAGDIKSRIVTNAFWATDRLVWVSRLTVLKEAGLTELNY